MSCDPRYARWRRIELREGERISGKVVRLPRSGAFNGGSVFLALDCDEVVALPATAQKGHTVLERLLGDVSVSDSVEIAYHGMRATADGERRYRDYELRVLGRQAVARLDDYRAMALRRGLALVGSGVNATATIPSELRERDQWVLGSTSSATVRGRRSLTRPRRRGARRPPPIPRRGLTTSVP